VYVKAQDESITVTAKNEKSFHTSIGCLKGKPVT
jgi:hypothetical protein